MLKDTLEAANAGVKLYKLGKALSDGVGLDDVDEFVGAVTVMPAAIDGINNIPEELANATPEDQIELENFAKSIGIEISDKEKIQEAVEHFANGVLHLAQGGAILAAA